MDKIKKWLEKNNYKYKVLQFGSNYFKDSKHCSACSVEFSFLDMSYKDYCVTCRNFEKASRRLKDVTILKSSCYGGVAYRLVNTLEYNAYHESETQVHDTINHFNNLVHFYGVEVAKKWFDAYIRDYVIM